MVRHRRPVRFAAAAACAAILSLSGARAQAKTIAPDLPPASDFVRDVTNPWFPLVPGTVLVYEGESEGVVTRNVVEVLHKPKRILGIDCTTVRDRAYEGGILVEDTLDWYAQDENGNVWYFGEDSKELDAAGNVVSTEGSWEAGVDGAKPGLIMLADLRVGDRYAQEDAPDVAEDMAQVTDLSAEVCVPAGCFEGLLETKEWTPLETGVAERKLYARGIGLLWAETTHGGDETSGLVSVTPPRGE